jgi:hypothetical protein
MFSTCAVYRYVSAMCATSKNGVRTTKQRINITLRNKHSSNYISINNIDENRVVSGINHKHEHSFC